MRYSDLDTSKHVNNGRFVTYLEEARVAFFRHASVPMKFEHNWGRVLARVELDYLAPIFFEPEPVDVSTVVERIGTNSFTLRHLITHSGTVRAQGRVTVVGFDFTTKRSRPLNDAERAGLEAYLVE
jgi:acyl-CoA thioester hydrolase